MYIFITLLFIQIVTILIADWGNFHGVIMV